MESAIGGALICSVTLARLKERKIALGRHHRRPSTSRHTPSSATSAPTALGGPSHGSLASYRTSSRMAPPVAQFGLQQHLIQLNAASQGVTGNLWAMYSCLNGTNHINFGFMLQSRAGYVGCAGHEGRTRAGYEGGDAPSYGSVGVQPVRRPCTSQ
jgi:hypothetical protein